LIPIFILTCDRLVSLKESIESYKILDTPYEIVIIDFNSTYKPTVEHLKQLEANGTKVYWKSAITHPNHLNNANTSIQDYFKSHEKSNYVVTDADIALDNVRSYALDVYSYLLKRFPAIKVVGPMLRINDIPDYYPLKQHILSGCLGHHRHFHSQKNCCVGYENSASEYFRIDYIHAPIDTTFGMRRSGTQWSRLQPGIRVKEPFAARHLDWYVDPNNLTADQEYYMKNASKKIVSWSKIKKG